MSATMPDGALRDRVALVTGAGRGIGRRIAVAWPRWARTSPCSPPAVTANVYRPGAVDTAMEQWIRDQPAERIGAALHDRFEAMHADGQLITPERSARSLLDRIPGSQTGEIWSFEPASD